MHGSRAVYNNVVGNVIPCSYTTNIRRERKREREMGGDKNMEGRL